jgi:hypothetical protein
VAHFSMPRNLTFAQDEYVFTRFEEFSPIEYAARPTGIRVFRSKQAGERRGGSQRLVTSQTHGKLFRSLRPT